MTGSFRTDTTALVTAVGGGLAILGAIFPWTVAPAGATQYGIEGLGVLTAGLGTLAIGFGVVATEPRLVAATAGVGLAIGAAGAVTLLSGGPASPRAGAFLTVVAGALVVFGAGYRYLDEPTDAEGTTAS